ncbi:hypothetical protein Asn12ST33_05060 [Cutibacterium acnes]|nr:hypothetical protein [Streptococcus pneumoniae]PZA01994.1 hypothetical protein Asn12ST33_05060 [Cutibacterium acnes]
MRYDLDSYREWLSPEDCLKTLVDARLLILTGGEPLIHQHNPGFKEILRAVTNVHVETNGTLPPRTSLQN